MSSTDWIINKLAKVNKTVLPLIKKKVNPFEANVSLGMRGEYAHKDTQTVVNGASFNSSVSQSIQLQINGQYFKDLQLSMKLGAVTGGAAQTQTIQFAANTGAIFIGQWDIYIKDNNSDIDSEQEVNATDLFDETTTAAAILTALNNLPIVNRYGGLASVALTAGSLAAGTALFTIVWNRQTAPPIFYARSRLFDTVSGVNSTAVSAVTVAGVGYKPYAGLNGLKKIVISCAGVDLCNYPFKEYMNTYLRRLDPGSRAPLLDAAGGIAPVSGDNVRIYIPTPWTIQNQINDEINQYFPFYNVNPNFLDIEVTFEDASNLCSGAGSGLLSSAVFHVKDYVDRSKDVKYAMKPMKLLWNDAQSTQRHLIPSGTRTKVDMSSFYGVLRRINIALITVADWDAGNYYNLRKADRLEVFITGDEYDKYVDNNEASMNNFINKERNYSYNGQTAIFSFEAENNNSIKYYTGGIDVKSLNNFDLYVEHSIGENCYAFVTGDLWAIYNFEKGQVTRKR